MDAKFLLLLCVLGAALINVRSEDPDEPDEPFDGRALHVVFNIPERKQTIKFYREVLGMKVLRHEENVDEVEGEEPSKWSKTMVGYGPEDDHFVVELTYNYGITSYEKGNDFISLTVRSKEALERAEAEDWPVLPGNILEAPGGFKFKIIDEPQPTDADPVEKVTLASSDLAASITYWNETLGLKILDKTSKTVSLGYKENEAKLELVDIGVPVDHFDSYVRICYSVPHDQQAIIEDLIEEKQYTLLLPLTEIPTPGKATVRIMLLEDPDRHESCYVDDEAFRELSQVDPDSDDVLNRILAEEDEEEEEEPFDGRALHVVFNIPERKQTLKFYREVLGMKVLRHEENVDEVEGEEPSKWSKTMVGYGPEDDHFVVELTYNYGITSYEKGNDFISLTVRSKEALERAEAEDWPVLPGNILEAPGGFRFKIIDEPQPIDADPVEKVTLASSDLAASITYWNETLGLKILDQTSKTVSLGYKENEAKLELVDIGVPVDHFDSYVRICYSVPHDQQPIIEDLIEEKHYTLLLPLTEIPTPGKATVRIMLLEDPDRHESCYVDDEAFRELSQVDPDSEDILNKIIAEEEEGDDQ